MTTDTPDPFPHVQQWQRDIVAEYGEMLNNTGGNDPLDLLNDLQRPGTDERPNRLMSVNIVRFTLAIAVSAQVGLLATLQKKGLLVIPQPDHTWRTNEDMNFGSEHGYVGPDYCTTCGIVRYPLTRRAEIVAEAACTGSYAGASQALDEVVL